MKSSSDSNERTLRPNPIAGIPLLTNGQTSFRQPPVNSNNITNIPRASRPPPVYSQQSSVGGWKQPQCSDNIRQIKSAWLMISIQLVFLGFNVPIHYTSKIKINIYLWKGLQLSWRFESLTSGYRRRAWRTWQAVSPEDDKTLCLLRRWENGRIYVNFQNPDPAKNSEPGEAVKVAVSREKNRKKSPDSLF